MKTPSPSALWLVPLAAALAGACSGGDSTPADTKPYSREKLLDPKTCNECHQDHYREWSGSMHAYASTDPVFRAMNARGQKETNGALDNFCVNCHAPLAVSEGKTQDGTDLDAVPAELQGVTCYFCHNVTDVNDTHNNPLALANDTTMRGGITGRDGDPPPLKFKGHGTEYSRLHDSHDLDSSKLCGACHDIVVPGHFSGAANDAGVPSDVLLEKTFAEWKSSIFSLPQTRQSPFPPQNCGNCHFGLEKGVPIANPPGVHQTMPTRKQRHRHTFPAVDTALVDFPERDVQLGLVKDALNIELRVEACVDPVGQGITVSLENLSAAHYFPSGASQDRRLWVELHGYKQGKEVFQSGVVPADTAATDVPGTWILRDETLKADGKTPAHMFWDVARVNSRTIGVSIAENPNANIISRRFPPTPETQGLQRLTVKVWLEPIGLDVVDDMIAAGYLDRALRDSMPRFTLVLPSALNDAGAAEGIALDWTLARAIQPDNLNAPCLENTVTKFPKPAP
jgi:hypothetical protein